MRKLNLEVLENRLTPSLYDWTGAFSTEWEVAANWNVAGVVATSYPGNGTTSDDVQFGSTGGTKSCAMTYNHTIDTLTTGGTYTGTITLRATLTVSSHINLAAADSFVITTGSRILTDNASTSTWRTDNITGVGTLEVSGGTLNIPMSDNNITGTVLLTVDAGATVTFGTGSYTYDFGSDGAISNSGTVNLSQSTSYGSVLMSANNDNPYSIINSGTINRVYDGTTGGAEGELRIGLQLSNYGTLNLGGSLLNFYTEGISNTGGIINLGQSGRGTTLTTLTYLTQSGFNACLNGVGGSVTVNSSIMITGGTWNPCSTTDAWDYFAVNGNISLSNCWVISNVYSMGTAMLIETAGNLTIGSNVSDSVSNQTGGDITTTYSYTTIEVQSGSVTGSFVTIYWGGRAIADPFSAAWYDDDLTGYADFVFKHS